MRRDKGEGEREREGKYTQKIIQFHASEYVHINKYAIIQQKQKNILCLLLEQHQFRKFKELEVYSDLCVIVQCNRN